MAELLTEQEQQLIYSLMSRLVPDDVATPEDIAAIRNAEAEYARGETVHFSSTKEMAAHFGVNLDEK